MPCWGVQDNLCSETIKSFHFYILLFVDICTSLVHSFLQVFIEFLNGWKYIPFRIFDKPHDEFHCRDSFIPNLRQWNGKRVAKVVAKSQNIKEKNSKKKSVPKFNLWNCKKFIGSEWDGITNGEI